MDDGNTNSESAMDACSTALFFTPLPLASEASAHGAPSIVISYVVLFCVRFFSFFSFLFYFIFLNLFQVAV
jgi:hypothetical protein